MATQGEGFASIKSSEIEYGRFLGRGGFGGVVYGNHRHWGSVAVKELRDISLTDEIRKEADKMWSVVSCPYLVRLMGIIEEPTNLSIVMEYCEYGSLKDFNRKFMIGYNCWARKVKMIQDIALGMNYLHTQKPPIIHSDLKLENIFVGDGLNAKIGDLGLAISGGTSISQSILVSKTKGKLAGTCTHLPPEAWAGSIQKANKLFDVFTFGITLYEFVSGKDPWQAFADATIISVWVKTGHRPNLEAIPSDAPVEITSIMKRAWTAKPTERPPFQEIQKLVTGIYQRKYKAEIHRADGAIMKKMDSASTAASAEAASLPRDSDSGVCTGVDSNLQHMSVKESSRSTCVDVGTAVQDDRIPRSTRQSLKNSSSSLDSAMGCSEATYLQGGDTRGSNHRNGKSSDERHQRQIHSADRRRSQSKQSDVDAKHLALYDYVAMPPDVFSCKKGDPILILDDTNADWWLAKSITNSQEGYVPSNYVEEITHRHDRHEKGRDVGRIAYQSVQILDEPDLPVIRNVADLTLDRDAVRNVDYTSTDGDIIRNVRDPTFDTDVIRNV